MSVQFARARDVEAAPMQGETILFNASTNTFCVLNASAAVVWDGLQTPQSAEGLASRICETFDGVSTEQATRDVETALQEFTRLSLVVQA